MKHYISEGRAIYEDINHGLFSKKLAEWAISNMTLKNGEHLKPIPLETVKDVLKINNIKLDESLCYTAWYLFNMTKADYAKSLVNDQQRANFVDETINDPDCCPEAVLECFTAKMCTMGIPIHCEEYL